MKNARFLGSEININGYTKQAVRMRINKAKDMLNAIKWRILKNNKIPKRRKEIIVEAVINSVVAHGLTHLPLSENDIKELQKFQNKVIRDMYEEKNMRYLKYVCGQNIDGETGKEIKIETNEELREGTEIASQKTKWQMRRLNWIGRTRKKEDKSLKTLMKACKWEKERDLGQERNEAKREEIDDEKIFGDLEKRYKEFREIWIKGRRENEEENTRRQKIKTNWIEFKKKGFVKLEKIINLQEEEKKDLEQEGIELKGITGEAQWSTEKIRYIKDLTPDMIRNTWEWKSLVRMLGDKRVQSWNKEGEGIKCKQCEGEFETSRGLICHLAKTQKKREEKEEEINLNTEYEEEEKESVLIRAFFEAENVGNFCIDRYISIKKREEREDFGQTREEMEKEQIEEMGCPWEEDEDICDPESFGERICTFPKNRNIKEASDWCVLCRTRWRMREDNNRTQTRRIRKCQANQEAKVRITKMNTGKERITHCAEKYQLTGKHSEDCNFPEKEEWEEKWCSFHKRVAREEEIDWVKIGKEEKERKNNKKSNNKKQRKNETHSEREEREKKEKQKEEREEKKKEKEEKEKIKKEEQKKKKTNL